MKNKPQPFLRLKSRTNLGFSLIELLAVVLIIGLLMAASAPFYQGSMVALRLASDGAQFESMLSSAQQSASAEGRNIEVRFYKYTDPQQLGVARYRSIVLLRYYQVGETNPDPKSNGAPLTSPLAVIMGDTHTFASGIVMSENSSMSTLLGSGTPPGVSVQTKILTNTGLENWSYPVNGANYHSFVLRPEGTSLDPNSKWFVTLVADRDEEGSPGEAKNFYCIQIDPVNGRVTSYRP